MGRASMARRGMESFSTTPPAGNSALTGMHLWYLAWLFAFTLLLYPLMRWLLGRGWGVS